LATTKNIRKAVIFALLSAVSLSLMALFVKLASPNTNNNMTVFFRFSISFIYIFIIMVVKKAKGQVFPYKTKHIWLHILRSFLSFATMMLFYYSLKYISLVNGNLLVMTNALFIPILSFLIFRKKTNFSHWGAVIIGFIGVVLVLNPDPATFNSKSLIALGAGFAGALAIMTIRIISKYDLPHTSMFYYFPLAFIMSAIVSIFNWQTPDLDTLILLLCVGIFGTFYQEFLIRASQYAASKIISSLLYTSIVFSGFLGLIFFGEAPSLISVFGIVFVCLGSLLTIKFVKD
jgi:drug/metabolite transporter (DMT)-like permease